jgi:hypothetical protein
MALPTKQATEFVRSRRLKAKSDRKFATQNCLPGIGPMVENANRPSGGAGKKRGTGPVIGQINGPGLTFPELNSLTVMRGRPRARLN